MAVEEADFPDGRSALFFVSEHQKIVPPFLFLRLGSAIFANYSS